jgi:hypothetical protein
MKYIEQLELIRKYGGELVYAGWIVSHSQYISPSIVSYLVDKGLIEIDSKNRARVR